MTIGRDTGDSHFSFQGGGDTTPLVHKHRYEDRGHDVLGAGEVPMPSGERCRICGLDERNAVHDPVQEKQKEIRPNYYKVTTQLRNHDHEIKTVECWDIIEALGLTFYLGTAFAYLWRCGKKEGQTKRMEIQKTITYLNAELTRMDRDGEP